MHKDADSSESVINEIEIACDEPVITVNFKPQMDAIYVEC